MPRLLMLAALLLLIAPAAAQTVEYELPTEIEVVPGRLSVTFADTVGEARARRLVRAAGYDVVESRFKAVEVSAYAARPLPADLRTALAGHEAVADVHESEVVCAPSGLNEVCRVAVTLFLHYRLPDDVLADLLTPNVHLHAVARVPRDLVVAVEQGREEEASTALGALPAVRYVAYLMEGE